MKNRAVAATKDVARRAAADHLGVIMLVLSDIEIASRKVVSMTVNAAMPAKSTVAFALEISAVTFSSAAFRLDSLFRVEMDGQATQSRHKAVIGACPINDLIIVSQSMLR